jgi:organic hydroperoxide reductase OsmC/OhrA
VDQEVFNMQIRKFLKKVGITSQREIENAVRQALEDGRLAGTEKVQARVTLELPGLDLEVQVDDTIALEKE